jgi:hypothetical protein
VDHRTAKENRLGSSTPDEPVEDDEEEAAKKAAGKNAHRFYFTINGLTF